MPVTAAPSADKSFDSVKQHSRSKVYNSDLLLDSGYCQEQIAVSFPDLAVVPLDSRSNLLSSLLGISSDRSDQAQIDKSLRRSCHHCLAARYFESSNWRDPSSCSGKSSVEAKTTAKHLPRDSGRPGVHRKLASRTCRAMPEKEKPQPKQYTCTHSPILWPACCKYCQHRPTCMRW